MSYEALDAIADTYIPLLLIVFLLGVFGKTYRLWPDYRGPLTGFLYFAGLLVIAYGLMFFDKAVGLWPTLGLDYSTHTAVALSLVFALCNIFPDRWRWLVVSMLAYAGLMLYQQYHSLLDIISTSVVLAAIALLFNRYIARQKTIKSFM
ncbi:hypothetical protein [Cellvibrio sp. UBA7661]|uniref:hypothetical protein n=1 Tax=Cellvibrio sp. UBA7661 TaxID=1946311 RepID=UPI002F3541ED